MKRDIKKIGVFTSGGDAPGMNAAIRAVVRAGIFYDMEVIGIYNGYKGLIQDGEENFKTMTARHVSGILNKGGTILRSARSEEFRTEAGMEKAYQSVTKAGIDGLIAIGGDGTFTGAHIFGQKYNFPIIGIPATIDNDLVGSDYTLGYDTATNTAVEAIDRIRDTASSHSRLFFIEVMGRDKGFIALRAAIATGAETFLIPEREISDDRLLQILDYGKNNKKTSSIVIVAEGAGSALDIGERLKQRSEDYDIKVTILGHLQRGGSPTCFDRILASRLGVLAVEGLMKGYSDVMVGLINRKPRFTPLETAINGEREIDEELLRVDSILAI